MVRSFVHACVVRVFLTLDSFSSLWAAFTPTVHINALYNESVHRQEQHTSGIYTMRKQISYVFTFTFSNRGILRDSRVTLG